MVPKDPGEVLFQEALRRHQSRQWEEAEKLYRLVLAASPRHVGALRHLAEIATQFGWLDAAVDLLRQALVPGFDLPDLHDQLGQVLQRMGNHDAAICSFERALAIQPGFAVAQVHLEHARDALKLSRDSDYAGPSGAPWPADAGVWREAGGNTTVFVLFAGLGVGQSPPTFIFRNFLGDYGTVDKLFVRDLSYSWYLRGISGVSTSVATTAAYLERELAGYERTVFIGCSAGAMAAILYGHLLGVDKVIAFAPQTVVSERKPRELMDQRWEQRLIKLRREVEDSQYLDLTCLRPLNVPVDIYYPLGIELDRVHAESLSGDAVTHLPQPGDSHLIALDMRDRGLLRPIIEGELPKAGLGAEGA
jgi:tetratricopeptide (TPR) repeat protein